jgi:hypothetical protein
LGGVGKLISAPGPKVTAAVLEIAEEWDRLADEQEQATDLKKE